MEEYLKRDIAKVINKPIRTIQFWTDKGLVVPDIVPSEGKGKARVYSKRNLIEFAMIDVMCGPGRMYLELSMAKSILDMIRWGGVGESGFQYGFGKPKGKNLLSDFYTSPVWGDTKELACVLSTDRSLNDENTVTEPVEGFFVISKDEKEFSKEYCDYISSKGDSVYLPLARQIIFIGGIRNTALDLFGIKL